jgi:hypothetical protein
LEFLKKKYKLLLQRPSGRLRVSFNRSLFIIHRSEIDTFDSTKRNLKVNRKYIVDYTFFLSKETPSETHVAAADHLEAKIAHVVIKLSSTRKSRPFIDYNFIIITLR